MWNLQNDTQVINMCLSKSNSMTCKTYIMNIYYANMSIIMYLYYLRQLYILRSKLGNALFKKVCNFF